MARRQSCQFQSIRPPKDDGYKRLVERFEGRGTTVSNRRILATGGQLVSGTRKLANGIEREDNADGPWHHVTEIMHCVYAFLGYPQLFLGQVDDDYTRMLQLTKLARIKPTLFVSKSWAALARSQPKIDFKPLRYSLTDNNLQVALKQFPHLKYLDLSECRKLRFLSPIFTVGRNLVSLHLVGCLNLTDATLGVVTMEMPKLRNLYVPACSKLETVPVHRHIGGHGLEILDISGNNKITDSTVSRLMTDHPHLLELYASQLELLSTPVIASKCLTLLNLDGNEKLTFSSAVKILSACPAIKYVSLTDNDTMLDEKVKLFPSFTNIVELNISSMFQNDDTVNSCMTGMPNLTLFDCSNSEFLIKPNFQHAKLEVLVANLCWDLTDEALTNLDKKLPSLVHLSCNHCDSLVRPFIAHPTVKLIDFSTCRKLLSDATSTCWLKCPEATSIFLGHNPGLVDRELETLTPFMTAVTDLNLYQATSLQKPNIFRLINLERINITNCWELHQDWVDNLKLPKLQTIYVSPVEEYADDGYQSVGEGGDPGGW